MTTLLGKAAGLVIAGVMMWGGLGQPGTAAASGRESVEVKVYCAGAIGTKPVKPGNSRTTAGSRLGKSWAYDWTCHTRRDQEGTYYNYVKVDADQWGNDVQLNVVVVTQNAEAVSLLRANGLDDLAGPLMAAAQRGMRAVSSQ